MSGPGELAARAAAALERVVGARGSASALPAIAGLLARREGFLERLRARLAANRAELAAASLGERPWTFASLLLPTSAFREALEALDQRLRTSLVG